MGREAKFKQLRKFFRARAKEAALAGDKLPGDMKSFVDSFMRPAKYARTLAVLKAPETRAKSGRKGGRGIGTTNVTVPDELNAYKIGEGAP